MGVLAGLAAALAWTLASSLWRSLSTSLTAIQLNGLKNWIACLILTPVLLGIPWFEQTGSCLILLSSGVVGIAIGDSFYLAALRRLGTRRTLTFEAVAPLAAGISGLIWMGERVSGLSWAGAVLVSASVLIVARQQPPDQTSFTDRRRTTQLLGATLALLAVVCGVGGAALSRGVLLSTSLTPLQSAAVRLLGGGLALLPWLRHPAMLPGRSVPVTGPTPAQSRAIRVVAATLLGTNVGILLQQTALQRLPLAVAITLLSTAPVMALLVARHEGDKPQLAGHAASLLAVSGVALAMLN